MADQQGPMKSKNVRPALGEAGRSRTRSGDGEGWGRDRDREFLGSARRDGRRRIRLAERHPQIRVRLRLPLHEAVAGLIPG